MTSSTATALIPYEPPAESDSEIAEFTAGNSFVVPAIVANAGDAAAERFLEFFAANIRNKNTRSAYYRQVCQFLRWCEGRNVTELRSIRPMLVAAYIETMKGEPQTVKQGLAAIRMLFDWLVIGQVVPSNPATSVRGPKYSYTKGKTPVLDRKQARQLLDSIPITHEDKNTKGITPLVVGLRDRAFIALMLYSFARVGAVTAMTISDYYANGKRYWIRLHEKGGKFHEVPVHHTAEEYLDAYLDVARIRDQAKTPLFRTTRGRSGKLTANPLPPREALDMIKRRAAAAGFSKDICNHTFRATGITAYLEGGGTIENAQAIASHTSPRTTKLYDRRGDQISLDEIEKIQI
jgi:site-specific recombinase XerD